jgi:excisionase family DNA binding protein
MTFQNGARSMLENDLLTDTETRALLRMSRTTLWRLRKASTIPYSKVGGRYRYSRAELLRWLNQSAQPPASR